MVLVDNSLVCKHCKAELLKEEIVEDKCPKCGEIYNRTTKEETHRKFFEREEQTAEYHIAQINFELSKLMSTLRVYKFMEKTYPAGVSEKATWLIQELDKLKNQLKNYGTKKEETL